MTILYALQHAAASFAPQADAEWIGKAGPGPSYGDDGIGYDKDFTQRHTPVMTWNLMHLAGTLKGAGGLPAQGNQRSARAAGCQLDPPNSDYC